MDTNFIHSTLLKNTVARQNCTVIWYISSSDKAWTSSELAKRMYPVTLTLSRNFKKPLLVLKHYQLEIVLSTLHDNHSFFGIHFHNSIITPAVSLCVHSASSNYNSHSMKCINRQSASKMHNQITWPFNMSAIIDEACKIILTYFKFKRGIFYGSVSVEGP